MMQNGIKQNVNILIKRGTLALKANLIFSLETDREKKETHNTLVADLSVLAQKSHDGLKRFRMRKMAIKLSAQM